MTDRDLIRIRLRFLDILKSFFQDQPDAELLSRWRGIFAALDGQHITPGMDKASHELGELLSSMPLQEIKDEHHALFVDPYSKQLLPLTAAYYIDGKSFGPSLARYRDILKEGQVIKESDFTDSDDSLPIMLDVLIALIQEEKQGDSETRHLQDQLLLDFLIPTVKAVNTQMSKAVEVKLSSTVDVKFYIKCVAFLAAYLELELGLLEEETSSL